MIEDHAVVAAYYTFDMPRQYHYLIVSKKKKEYNNVILKNE